MCTFEWGNSSSRARHGHVGPNNELASDLAFQLFKEECRDLLDSIAVYLDDSTGADVDPNWFPGADVELDVSTGRPLTRLRGAACYVPALTYLLQVWART